VKQNSGLRLKPRVLITSMMAEMPGFRRIR
jgi:hypothetical protein